MPTDVEKIAEIQERLKSLGVTPLTPSAQQSVAQALSDKATPPAFGQAQMAPLPGASATARIPSTNPKIEGIWDRLKSAGQPKEQPGGLAALWEGLKRGGRDVLEGGAAIGAKMGPEEGAAAFTNPADLARRQQAVQQFTQQGAQAYAQNPAAQAHPMIAGAGRIGGNIAANAPLMAGGGIGGVAQRGITGGIQGALAAGGSPGQMALGAGIGAGTGMLGSAIGPMASQAAMKIAQQSPTLARMAIGSMGRSVDNFQKATAQAVLEPIGQMLAPGVKIGHDLVNAVKDRLDDAYNAVKQNLTFRETPAYAAKVKDLSESLSEGVDALAPAQAEHFTRILKGIEKRVSDGGGTIGGDAYKKLESGLGQKVTDYIAGKDASQRELGYALAQLQAHMREALLEENPESAPALQQINKAWSRYIAFAGAAGRNPIKEGEFAPHDLLYTIGKGSERAKRTFAEGNKVMQAFGEGGNKLVRGGATADVLKTVLLHTAGSAIGAGAGSLIGGTTGAAIGGAVGGLAPVAAAPVARQIGRASRSETAKGIGRGVSSAAPFAAEETTKRVSTIGP
jgi:hypothetical protein